MGRPVSVLVNRSDISLNDLKKIYKKTHDLDNGLRILAIMNMIKLKNAETVADFLQVEADTIRRWVYEFNTKGLASFEKKKPRPDPAVG
jgi:transposase